MICNFAESCVENCAARPSFEVRAQELEQTESAARDFGFEVTEGSVECVGTDPSAATARCIARVIRPRLINTPEMIPGFSESTRAFI